MESRRSNIPRQITAIHEWIRSGDIYQLNFTLPLPSARKAAKPRFTAACAACQPAPYAAFLHTHPNRRILSFSPELFFQLENQAGDRRITTRPMKGTAPRGRTTSEDLAHSDWLRNDPKNRAENVMIVDLLRSDLGRLCTFGAVRTQNLFAVERYPTLWQMTSTVTGELRADVNFQQIFRALFPCGSITGAPKVRAMQLLAQLEHARAASIPAPSAFFRASNPSSTSPSAPCNSTAMSGAMGVGSGIVIDSVPAEEYRECLLKAEFLTRHTEPFSLLESLLWQGDYPLLELHLDRLEDSARYFAFPCDRAEVKAALLAHAVTIAQMPVAPGPGSPRTGLRPWGGGLAFETWDSTSNEQSRKSSAPSIPRSLAEWVGNHETQSLGPSRKVRLLLDQNGNLQIEDELLPNTPHPSTQSPSACASPLSAPIPTTPCSSTKPPTGPSTLQP